MTDNNPERSSRRKRVPPSPSVPVPAIPSVLPPDPRSERVRKSMLEDISDPRVVTPDDRKRPRDDFSLEGSDSSSESVFVPYTDIKDLKDRFDVYKFRIREYYDLMKELYVALMFTSTPIEMLLEFDEDTPRTAEVVVSVPLAEVPMNKPHAHHHRRKTLETTVAKSNVVSCVLFSDLSFFVSCFFHKIQK